MSKRRKKKRKYPGEFERETGDPWQKLAAEVLLRAIWDVMGHKMRVRDKELTSEEARAWLVSRDAEIFFDRFNLDIEATRQELGI